MYLRVESCESSPTCVNKLALLRKYSPDLRETNFVWKSNDWAFSCSANEDIMSFCIQILKGRIIEVGDRYFRAISSSLAMFCMLDMVFCWYIAMIRFLRNIRYSSVIRPSCFTMGAYGGSNSDKSKDVYIVRKCVVNVIFTFCYLSTSNRYLHSCLLKITEFTIPDNISMSKHTLK